MAIFALAARRNRRRPPTPTAKSLKNEDRLRNQSRQANDPAVLPPEGGKQESLSRMWPLGRLCRTSPSSLPLWRRQKELPPLPDTLLSARYEGQNQARDALFGPADDAAPSCHGVAPSRREVTPRGRFVVAPGRSISPAGRRQPRRCCAARRATNIKASLWAFALKDGVAPRTTG